MYRIDHTQRNSKLTTYEQEIERKQATPKMRAFHKPYRLKVFGLRKTETRVDNKVAKKVTGQEGVD